MIYRSVIDLDVGFSKWLILVAAMVGSSLILASFLKVLNALFFAKPSSSNENIKEVPWALYLPPIFLAVLSLLLGIFSGRFIPSDLMELYPEKITLLLVMAFTVGFLIYLIQKTKIRKTDVFAGGEEIPGKISGVDFYKTIYDWKVFGKIYSLAERKYFDIYEIISKAVLKSGSMLSAAHSGILHTYLAWCLIAGVVLFLIYMADILAFM
jgi:NADH:ubiquinone oxidoreductase subunit 5 (subunit L)/multisubunit Na+/H+ antiporter MnhA subunit